MMMDLTAVARQRTHGIMYIIPDLTVRTIAACPVWQLYTHDTRGEEGILAPPGCLGARRRDGARITHPPC